MAAHLVTGYKGEEHIQSADQGSFNASFFGTGQYVMEAGNQMEASIVDNNTVRIVDGDILMKGRHIRINPNTYEDLTIETGTAGTYRNDLIVMRYEKNNSTGVETASLVVIKGTETEGTASDPSYTNGDILGGALLNDMPLYRVKIEGVVLSEVETLFETLTTFATLAEEYEQEFIVACQTYLGSLNILDSKSEIEANTQPNQLAGALAVKEVIAALGDAATVRYDPETDMIQIYDGTTWHDWKSGGLLWDGYIQRLNVGTSPYYEQFGGWTGSTNYKFDQGTEKTINFSSIMSATYTIDTINTIDTQGRNALQYEYYLNSSVSGFNLQVLKPDGTLISEVTDKSGGTHSGTIDLVGMVNDGVKIKITWKNNGETRSGAIRNLRFVDSHIG